VMVVRCHASLMVRCNPVSAMWCLPVNPVSESVERLADGNTQWGYMDTTRLETASLIEKLPDFLDEKTNGTQLGTQATVANSPDVAQAVTANGSSENSEHVQTKAIVMPCPSLSQFVTLAS
jgi:hypothetical protein